MLPDILGMGGTLDEVINALSENEAQTLPEEPDEYQNMESFAFFLWINEEVDKEQARRQAGQQKAPD